MNTFLWLQDYQWVAISSIATTAGVLIALFIPLKNKRQERSNIIYLHSQEILSFIYTIDDLQNVGRRDDSPENIIIKQACMFSVLDFNTWEKESYELAKYNREIYELFGSVTIAIRSASNMAQELLDPKNADIYDDTCLAFVKERDNAFDLVNDNRKSLEKKIIH
ncbi:hypothetical protein [uncultured Sphaerochaeta sp.]|uniref:hypothetical protein n=1 Tax=uncultured Sphaerochaeta sp. TaxID=886478 RepID=UPI002A0A134F|nr:hypothetical protein [uncultured Sphaerochaeta sp.]